MIEEKIFNLVEKTINQLGFELIKITLQGGSSKILQILIERLDGQKVLISDCGLVSKNISALLDVEDYIKDKYFLEVSSPGIERPLVKLTDFAKFIGSEVKINLKVAVNGKAKYKGLILRVEDNIVAIGNKNLETKLDYDNIKSANLVLTDKMFSELLASGKNRKKNKKKLREEINE